MKQIPIAISIAAALALTFTAQAQNGPNYNDTVNCKWRDGRDMSQSDCEFFRKRKAEDEAEQARYLQYEQERRQQWQQEQEALQRKAEERKARDAELAAAAKRKIDQDLAEQRKAVEERRLQEEKEEVARKKKCGKDFNALRIGLSIDRYEECSWGGLVYLTETVTGSGVVEIYRSPFYIIHARDGRIVSFTRR